MRLHRRTLLLATAAGAATTVLSACGGGDDEPMRNIVETAQADPQLSLLVEAVQAAGLAGTLSGPGPLTVLAPTNAAFTALLTELGLTREALFANRPLLQAVLTYHVLGASVPAAAVLGQLGKPVVTVQGGVFKVEQRGALTVTDGRNRTAAITRTDIMATNGVIHLVDRVLLPADKTVVQTAQAISDFSILVQAVVAAGLVEALGGPGPYTVFAPTNAAFSAALDELGLTQAQLLASPLLGDILKYHVVAGRVFKAEVPVGTPIATLQGQAFTVAPTLDITDARGRTARITATDVLASNGVVHVIDRVILPAAA